MELKCVDPTNNLKIAQINDMENDFINYLTERRNVLLSVADLGRSETLMVSHNEMTWFYTISVAMKIEFNDFPEIIALQNERRRDFCRHVQ